MNRELEGPSRALAPTSPHEPNSLLGTPRSFLPFLARRLSISRIAESDHRREVLGGERLTGAALDRLTHRCHILETKGESYRLQDAKRQRRNS